MHSQVNRRSLLLTVASLVSLSVAIRPLQVGGTDAPGVRNTVSKKQGNTNQGSSKTPAGSRP